MPYTAETKPGMGDPYWYEWSVGLKYIIDMLNTDNGIEYVELQANVPLGLDDVVVTYNSGEKLFVQVKHTRVEDTLTFGDLVSPEGGAKKSLLSVLAQSWDKVNGKYEHSKVMLFTNRTAGERAVKTRARHPVHRPALSEFVPAMKQRISAVAVFNDVSFPEYEDAWAEWVQQLECIRSDEDKLTFLRAFEIVTNNPGLTELQEELIQKLKLTFQIDDEKADILLGRLDHALRIWATSSRETSKISAEEVYSRLSLSNEKISYNHDLLPTDPFFASRIPLLQSIEEEIAAGQHSIIFISGIPGTGKTNIVSKLCAKRDSYIDIRYYAYEPINPEKEYLPSDVSRRVDKEYFWNELFNQLRNIMRGQLFKYRVPVLNEFMAIEEKREKFFEIAAAYAHDRGRDFIISIDGIDHAARATTFENTFLSTIPSPEYLPSNVKIILSGQPKKDYRNYPSWLLSADPEVIEICVPGIMPEDAFRVSNCSVEIRSIECFVETKDKWTSIVVADVLSFAVELIKHRLIERANALFKMWFSGITVGELCEIIDLQESENTLAVDTQELARNLGVCICYSGEYDMLKGIRSIIDDHHRFLTSMMDVVIENQLHELSNDSLKEALLSVEIINSEQLLKGLLTLLSENRINDISILSEVFGSRLMQTPNGILFSTFMDIVTSRFDAKTQEKEEIWKQIESLDFTGVPFENENAYYSIFAFVSAYLRPVSSFSAAHEIIELYYDKKPYRRDSIWGVFINNICMIGKWFSHYHSGDETCISAKELEKLMHPLFWEKWKPNVMNSELYALRPYLLKAYIFLSKTASEAVKTVINSVCQQAFANNPVDSMLDAGFYFYKDDIDRINQWYDDWLGEKGRAWNEALGERNRIIKHFLRALKLYDTNGCIRTAYAISKARWSVIGYVSHKEYTCDYLLKWYNGLVGKLGHALPNYAREIKSISDKTEQVGDNRIEHAINSRVYEDLFSCGYPTIVETLRDNWYLGQGIEMPEYLVDGLIGYLRDGTFSQEELIKIWSLGIALLDWKDDGNYDAIHSLQKAIELQAEKAGIKDIHETLIQYGQTYIDLVPDNERFEIPERWCDDHGTMRDELITDGILHDYMSGGEINKDVIGKGIEILSEKGRIEKSILVNLLEYELDHEEWGLEHNPIIAVLFKHLPAQDTNKYIVSFLDRILETKRSSLTTAVPTFARLALYQQEESYGRDGMDAIIQMHRDWLTAAGHFQQPELINQYDYKGIIEWDAVTDIFSLFYQIIQLIILSDDADAARVALSGLFALECIDEQFVYYIERDWNRYHYRAKEWLLMGYELLWNLCEERKGTILRCVEKHRTDSDFNVALYANLLFDSFSGKGGCSFAKKAQDYFSDIPSGRGQRLIISHSNSPWLTENEYAEKIISSLALFTGDDSLDIEEKTVAYLSCLKEEFSLIPLQRRKASWCKTVLYRAATAIFRILYKEWVNGRWAGREAQLARAILSASEPYMLFCSPKLWIGKGNKFIYDVGEYINKPDQIKKQELNKLFAYGLSENEVVLAGFLSEYSDKEELIGYQLTYFDFPWVSPSIVERQNEKNARFLLYKRCDFVGSSYPNISLYFSGIESFQNSKISCGISKTALSYFGWTIQLSQIGFILENKEAMPIGRLEQYFGYNDMRNRYPNNQPYLQRWVVRKDELFKNKGWKINSVVNTIIRPLT